MAESKIIIGADVSGVKSGVSEAKLSLTDLANTAQSAGKRGADGVKKMGEGAGVAAGDTERANKRMERAYASLENAIRRDIAMKQAGTKASREYYEALASQRGMDAGRLNPLLSQLDKLNAKTQSATISVEQYNNAMRMVPAQMTDIVTQLAGGQNPFLIAIQQGGQMRDMFGGFGTMFKGLASLITPARLAIGGVAGGVGALAYAMYQGAEESRAYQKALILAGDSAGLSASRLQGIAVSVGGITGGYGEAREAVLAFVDSGKVGAENYAAFTESVVLQSQATGRSVDDLVQKYTEIAQDPLKAVLSLSSVYQTMTADVYAQVKALKEQGREQEAVALVQKKYADESGEMSKRVLENLGLIERGWLAVKNAASGAWDDMKSIGRQATLQEQLQAIEKQLAAGGANTLGNVGMYGSSFQMFGNGERSRLEGERDRLKREIRAEEERAELAKQRNQQRQDQLQGMAALDGYRDRYATKNEQRVKAEIQLEHDRAKALNGVADAAKRAAINADFDRYKQRLNESFAEKPKHQRKTRTVTDSLSDNQKKLFALAQKYGEDPAKWLALYQIESASGKKMRNSQSGALGHFQIVPKFFGDYGVNAAGAMNLETSFLATRRHHERNSASLKRGLGRDLTAGEYYLGHQQGWGGASALLSNPNQNVVDVLTKAYGNSGKARAAVVQNGGRTSMTARQFSDMWIEKANQLQKQYAEKGIGSMDSASFDGIGAFSETPFDKWLQGFTESQEKARIQIQLTSENMGKTITNQLALMSNPEFANFSEEQRTAALEMAKKADVQEDVNKLTEKYRDLLIDLKKESERDFEDDLFEISLIGKKRDEIERLTAARRYDRMIAEAQASGASPDTLAALNTAKYDNDGRIEERQRLKTETQANYDNDWLGGLSDGMDRYRESFASMRESMAGAVTDSLGAMTDGLADFVATGKLDFQSLAASILQDLARIMVKIAIMNAMKAASKAMGWSDGGVVGYAAGGAVGYLGGGGYTGYGGKYEPAGVVHKGEVVFSQQDVRNHGGIQAVERLRLRGYADGGAVGIPAVTLNALQPNQSAGGGSVGNMQVSIIINRDGGADADSQADSDMGKKLAEALPNMIEQWYIKNVARPGAAYYKV